MADGRSHFASVLWFVFENFAIKLEDFYKSLNTFFGLCHVQNFVVDKLSKPRVVKCSCVSFVPLCGLTNKSFFFFYKPFFCVTRKIYSSVASLVYITLTQSTSVKID